MKVFLRNTQTGMFYAGPDRWTDQHREALEFDGPNYALDLVCQRQLGPVEVVVHFEESVFDVPLKIVGTGNGTNGVRS